MKKDINNDLAQIDNLEIMPLSDEELESVAGGVTDLTTANSCMCCAAGATSRPVSEEK
jgi:hypothetical protein